MSRLPDNATAMRFRNSPVVPAKPLSHFRITCRNKVVHDVLAPDAQAARLHVSKRRPGAHITNVRLMTEAAAPDLRRAG